MEKICPFSADLPKWPGPQATDFQLSAGINPGMTLPINLSTLEPVSKTSLNMSDRSSTLPDGVRESVNNQFIVNGFDVPSSVVMLREPVSVETKPVQTGFLAWPGVDAIMESYRVFDKGIICFKNHPFKLGISKASSEVVLALLTRQGLG